MSRWVVFILFAVVGMVMIEAGWIARKRWEPKSVTWDGDRYEIVKRCDGEALIYDLVRDGRVVESLSGSTDLVCDAPYIFLIDVDGDGSPDIYHHHCGGHGYLRYIAKKHTFDYVELGSEGIGDAPVLNSLWAEEIRRWRGLRLMAGGGLMVLIGMISGLALARVSRQS